MSAPAPKRSRKSSGGSKRKSSVWSPDIDTSEEARAREVKRSANRALRIFEATLTRQAETLRRWDLASTLRSLRPPHLMRCRAAHLICRRAPGERGL